MGALLRRFHVPTPSSPAASDPLASSNAVHARVVVRPVRDCPVTRLAGEFGISELVTPGEPDRAPQVVVESVPEERLVSLGAHPIVRAGDGTVRRLPSLARTDGGATACGHGSCLVHGFGSLPIDSYHMRREGVSTASEAALLDIDELTDRQREFPRAAAERGYFDTDGPSAADIAAELGIAKATLSEHLRVVQSELVRQAFDPPE